MIAQTEGLTFKQTTICGREMVYVFSPKPEKVDIYTVDLNLPAPTCNCPQFRHRCIGRAARCKHILGAQLWLSGLQAAEDAEQASPPAFDPGEVLDAEARNARAIADRQRLW